MMSETVSDTRSISPQEYCRLATRPVSGNGYSRLPQELLQAEQAFGRADKSAAADINRALCHSLLNAFSLDGSEWRLPATFAALYQSQLERIRGNLKGKSDDYFSLRNDPFLKDLAILRHRLIPFGAELATPYSGLARRLLVRRGWRQAQVFIKVVMDCGGTEPLLEMHLHPDFTENFTPAGWLDTYENLADFLAINPALRGVQSTSWFLDPVLEQVSPHLAYLRQVPVACGAVLLFAGDDDCKHSAAFATSQTRRGLYASGHYRPRLFTRIWPRQELLQRRWRASTFHGQDHAGPQ